MLQVGARQWDRVLEMVRRIRGLGMEVCTTLGMLTPEQAKQLREAGLTAYKHNLDTSPEFYEKVRSLPRGAPALGATSWTPGGRWHAHMQQRRLIRHEPGRALGGVWGRR